VTDHSVCKLYRSELHCAGFFMVLSFPLAVVPAKAMRGYVIWYMLSKAQLKYCNRQF